MRDLDEEFDSSDVVLYVPRVVHDEPTQPVSASMVYDIPAFDDSELDSVLAALTDDARPERPRATSRGADSSACRSSGARA